MMFSISCWKTGREPEKSFKFPPKQYVMKLSKTGYVNRCCSREWFRKFDFISYSKSEDGLCCLACVLFPDTSHHHPKKLITEPYQYWKDAMEDLLRHVSCDYHINTLTKLDAFKSTYKSSHTRIDMVMNDESTSAVKRNREFLKSLIKCLQFCGRQGIAT